jgi:hypothetical protein
MLVLTCPGGTAREHCPTPVTQSQGIGLGGGGEGGKHVLEFTFNPELEFLNSLWGRLGTEEE